MKASLLLKNINEGQLSATLTHLYGEARLEKQLVRYAEAVSEYVSITVTTTSRSSPFPAEPRFPETTPTTIRAVFLPPRLILT